MTTPTPSPRRDNEATNDLLDGVAGQLRAGDNARPDSGTGEYARPDSGNDYARPDSGNDYARPDSGNVNARPDSGNVNARPDSGIDFTGPEATLTEQAASSRAGSSLS
jgi:hypothetical protein